MRSSGGRGTQLGGKFVERKLGIRPQRSAQNLADFGLGRMAVTGRSPLQARDEIIVQVADAEVCHALSRALIEGICRQ